MGFRDKISNQPAVGAILAVVLLLVAVGLAMRFGQGTQPQRPTVKGEYFFNLNTGQVYEAPLGSRPPIDAPDGSGKGVRAYIYSCGACDPGAWFIAYIEKLTDEAKAEVEKTGLSMDDVNAILMQGRRVATAPDDGDQPEWVSPQSRTGMQLTQRHRTACDGNPPAMCSPR